MEPVATIPFPRWSPLSQLRGSRAKHATLAAAGNRLAASSPSLGLQHSGTLGVQASGSKGWPRGLRPIFVEEIPGRLEDCRQAIAAVDKDLGRLDPAQASSKDRNSGVSTCSLGREPESEVSPSSPSRTHSAFHSTGLSSLHADLDAEWPADEDIADTVSKLETEVLSLHNKWRAVDEDRHCIVQHGDCLATRLSNCEANMEAMSAEVSSAEWRLAQLEPEMQATRLSLAVSEADTKALRPRVAAAEKRVAELIAEIDRMHTRLYASQNEEESLPSQVVEQETSMAVLEERLRAIEAEAAQRETQRAMVARQAADKVLEALEAEVAAEWQAANARERELKLALATMALEQKRAEEKLKRLTGEGTPEPPRWFRSSVPRLLTRRKRATNGLMPQPGERGSGAGKPWATAGMAGDAATSGSEAAPGPPGLPADGSTEADADGPPEKPSRRGSGTEADSDEELALDAEGTAAITAIMTQSTFGGVPDLLFATKPGGEEFLPATLELNLADKSLCLQELRPAGPERKIPLGGIIKISRPEPAKGVVDVDVASCNSADDPNRLPEHAPLRLRLTVSSEDAASMLVAGISQPNRILPGSTLASRTSASPPELHTQTL